MSEYNEIVDTMRVCQSEGYDGFAKFYDELLTDHLDRGTLPLEVEERLMAESPASDVG